MYSCARCGEGAMHDLCLLAPNTSTLSLLGAGGGSNPANTGDGFTTKTLPPGPLTEHTTRCIVGQNKVCWEKSQLERGPAAPRRGRAMRLGPNLRAARTRRGLTVAEL